MLMETHVGTASRTTHLERRSLRRGEDGEVAAEPLHDWDGGGLGTLKEFLLPDTMSI